MPRARIRKRTPFQRAEYDRIVLGKEPSLTEQITELAACPELPASVARVLLALNERIEALEARK
jgi:hypothetical protein